MQVDEILDIKGQICPLPLVETRKRLNKLQPKKVLKVVGDNYPSLKGIADIMKDLGNEILDIDENGSVWSITIRKR